MTVELEALNVIFIPTFFVRFGDMIEPWFVFLRYAVEPKYTWRNRTSQLGRASDWLLANWGTVK